MLLFAIPRTLRIQNFAKQPSAESMIGGTFNMRIGFTKTENVNYLISDTCS